jgi:hypothetical protein
LLVRNRQDAAAEPRPSLDYKFVTTAKKDTTSTAIEVSMTVIAVSIHAHRVD